MICVSALMTQAVLVFSETQATTHAAIKVSPDLTCLEALQQAV